MRLRAIGKRIRPLDSRPFTPPDKSADSYYRTPHHKEWARAVIRAAGGLCQGAAHDPVKPRNARRLFADHIIERADGGALLSLANGQALCGSCHSRKTMQRRAARLRD